MGGIKNIYQMGTPFAKDVSHITDPFDRHAAMMSQFELPYCKYCGKQVLNASVDEHNRPVDFELEIKMGAHYQCHLNYEKNKPQPKPEEKPVQSTEDFMKMIQENYGVETKKTGEE